jgi:hypothetical protein
MYIDLKRILTLFILGCIFSNDGVLAQAKPEVEYYESGSIKSYKEHRFFDRYTESGELAYREYYVSSDDYSLGRYRIFGEDDFQNLLGTIRDKYEATYLTDNKIVRTNLKLTSFIKKPNSYYNFEEVRNFPIRMSYERVSSRDKKYFFFLAKDDWQPRYYDGVVSTHEGGKKCYEAVYISGIFIERPISFGCDMINLPNEAGEESDAIVLDKEGYIYNLSEFLKVFLYDVINADFEYNQANEVWVSYVLSNDYLMNFRLLALRDKLNNIPAFPFGKKGLEAELVFKTLEGEQIAVSRGMNDDTKVILEVDPVKWATASTPKKWYILYHELGHDVLNLNHGEGGRMMFNFPVGEYTWDDFFKDRDYMFKYVFDKHFSN